MFHQIRWTAQKIAQRLALAESLVYRQQLALTNFRFLKLTGPEESPPIDTDIDDNKWRIIEPGTIWAKTDTNFVLRSQFQLPMDWDKSLPVALFLPIGEAGDFSHPEALAYIDGNPFAACDRHHQEILLADWMKNGRSHQLTLHGWTGGTQELRHDPNSLPSRPRPQLVMNECQLVQIDQPTRDFVALARMALETAVSLDENDPTQAHLFNALDEAFKILDTRDPLGDPFYDSVSGAMAVLQDGVGKAGEPLDVAVTAVGHAHIDVAWLWTLAQTRRKAGRTFHTVLRLMEQFPDYHFVQSQPQLYEYVRQDYPELFAAIKCKIENGRWEAIGGMWVEADCNLAGSEALARQFVLGRQYFAKHFGEDAESPVLWLPDVFGYAWNLPQLIKEAGLEYFFTIKIGWSQYNRLPYDSFWWQGLDGTKVLTHFSPTKEGRSAFASSYNTTATPAQIRSTWTNFQQKDGGTPGTTPPLLKVYGHGDGGGGPTLEMQENLALAKQFPGLPKTKRGRVIDFFQDLEATVGHRLPTWNGELYLEYHRGTYTTQAKNKRANRKSEFLLHDAEFLATLASVFSEQFPVNSEQFSAFQYPQETLTKAWQLLCLNQFHDILPGSSITAVYEDSLAQYAEIEALGTQVRDDALAFLTQGNDGDLLLVNPTSFVYDGIVETDWTNLFLDSDSPPIPVQKSENGWLIAPGKLPPYSITNLHCKADEPSIVESDSSHNLLTTRSKLENQYLRVEFNEAGDITHIFDKENGRSVLPPNTFANQFQLFEDRPRIPDAWDMDIYYDDRMWLAEGGQIEIVENGLLRGMLKITHTIGQSEIVQRVSLTRNGRSLRFDTVVNWQERKAMLKVAFPVDILSPTATYDIQWGHVERPTHRNTSWDWARFETCAQKWVDLSEGNYGVSLLNDCKYGHDIYENVIRLTLLRGSVDPDPHADLGEHQFSYSLLPHAGPLSQKTVAEAYALNDPIIVYEIENSNAEAQTHAEQRRRKRREKIYESFVDVDQPNVVIETVKRAEEGNGIIVRLYENGRSRTPFTLTTQFPIQAAWRTNLLEENQEELHVHNNTIQAFIKPFQIMTVRIKEKS